MPVSQPAFQCRCSRQHLNQQGQTGSSVKQAHDGYRKQVQHAIAGLGWDIRSLGKTSTPHSAALVGGIQHFRQGRDC